MAAREDSPRGARHDDEVNGLTTQISFLEEEVAALRRRLSDSPRHVRLLEERLREAEASIATVTGQNERLASTLREARDQIVALKEEVDRLAQPPSAFGVFLSACEDGAADVFTGGRKMRVNVSPAVDLEEPDLPGRVRQPAPQHGNLLIKEGDLRGKAAHLIVVPGSPPALIPTSCHGPHLLPGSYT